MRDVIVINSSSELTPQKLRVGAYCRVSSDSDDQAHSFINQVDYYTRLISENPEWELVDIYADDSVTGLSADKRSEFQRMLKDCKRGRIDKILVKSTSRFSRNVNDSLTAIRTLQKYGVSLFFEKENIDTKGLTSEIFLSLYAALSQEESLSLSGNMRWSYEKRMESGDFITCKAPFGYRLIDKTLIPHTEEAEIVKLIFAEYLNGKGIQQIADELTYLGIMKREGGSYWHYNTVHRLLKNERFCGNALLQIFCSVLIKSCDVKSGKKG